MKLEVLKKNMWLDVCEGEVREMSDEYKELVNDIEDEDVEGGMYIFYFYKILDRLIEKKMVPDVGGDLDWIYNEIFDYGEGENFDKYLEEYEKMVFYFYWSI